MVAQLKAVWEYRYFWMSLVKMDIMLRYRRSVLGIGWSLLHPLAMTAVFCVVFSTLMNNGDWKQYAQETLTAMAVWAFIRDTSLQGCFSLIRNEAYIRQVPLPYAIYPLRTMLGSLVHYLITLAVVVAVVALMRGSAQPFVMLWAVLPAVLMTALFVWAVATIAGFATVYFHDVSHIVELGAQVLFYLTPIIYRKENLGKMAWIADVNPVVPFIEMVRLPLVFGTLPDPTVYAYATALTVGFLGLAVGVLGWLQKKVIFHM